MKDWTGNFELIDPRLVVIDHKYQRPEKEGLIAAIAANPTWEAFGIPVVFKRSGSQADLYYCADGQQRIRGVMRADVPPKRIPVAVFAVTGIEHEAQIFVRINEVRKALSAIEKHTGKVIAQEPAALAVERAVEKAGYSISASESPRGIRAIAALNYVLNLLGEEGLVQLLILIRDAWQDDPKALDTRVLRVLAEVVDGQNNNGGYSRTRLTKALAGTSPSKLLRKAEDIHYETGAGKSKALRRAFTELAKV